MQQLIQEIRAALPFAMPEAYLCDGVCKGCSLKLLDFLDSELSAWEGRLNDGDVPCLADLQRLARTSKKVHRVLKRNGLIES